MKMLYNILNSFKEFFVFVQIIIDQRMMQQQLAPDHQYTGALVLIDTPANMELGFDHTTWKVESKFKGIKNIPPGSHYLYFSLADQNHMFKVGKFYMFAGNYPSSTNQQQQTVVVLKWNKEFDDFVKVTGYEQTTIIQGVKDGYYDCYLGGYPSKRAAIWSESTNYITKAVLDQLDPVRGIHHIGQQYDQNRGLDKVEQCLELAEMCDIDLPQGKQRGEMEQQVSEKKEEKPTAVSEIRQVSKFNPIQGTIYYSEIPKKLNSLLEDTTNVNMDKTPILEYLLKNQYNTNYLLMLGQIQYSMVSFLFGQSLNSLQQWKKLINLVCLSQKAFYDTKHTEFLLKFIVVLFCQLKQLPKDFFIDELSKGNFMVQCLRRLAQYKNDQEVPQRVRKRIGKIIELLANHFGYYIQEEPEEDMPTIVPESQTYF